MKKLLIIALLLMLTAASYAQKATIEKVWIDHDQIRNGEKGMLIHVKFEVKNGKEHYITCQARVQSPKGTYLRSTNSNYKDSDGDVYVSKTDDATYENTLWHDMKLWLPLSAFTLRKGKHDYCVRVDIYDKTIKKHITVAPGYCSFIGTGSGNNNNQRNNNNCAVETWREELGYGGFVIVTQYPEGRQVRVRYRQCPNCQSSKICASCHGTRTCSLCNGRGGIITAGYGTYIPCTMCTSTGRCSLCKGTGQCICATSPYPGYVIGGTTTIWPDGSVEKYNAKYNKRDSNRQDTNDKGTKKGGGMCSKCGGRGFESARYQYAPASTHGWMQPYHNSSGSSCPYCGYKTDHYHYPCTECHGYGHN